MATSPHALAEMDRLSISRRLSHSATAEVSQLVHHGRGGHFDTSRWFFVAATAEGGGDNEREREREGDREAHTEPARYLLPARRRRRRR